MVVVLSCQVPHIRIRLTVGVHTGRQIRYKVLIEVVEAHGTGVEEESLNEKPSGGSGMFNLFNFYLIGGEDEESGN